MGKPDYPDSMTITTRYADYIESAHQTLITNAATYRAAIIDNSPFTYTVINPSDAFFMSGYVISDYPTVYDMGGKFVFGLDIEVLWNQIQSDSAYGSVISEIINAAANILEDDLDEQIAELFAQARTINAVMSSSYIIAEGNMRSKKGYALANLIGELRAKFSELAQRRWEKHLDWNDRAVSTFLKINELFFALHGNYLQNKSTVDVSNLLWPFTVLDHERVIIASLQGATTATTKGATSGWSQAGNIIGMGAGIANIGAQLGLFGSGGAAATTAASIGIGTAETYAAMSLPNLLPLLGGGLIL